MPRIVNIPDEIRAGDDYEITVTIPDYPSTDYTLDVRLINQSVNISLTVEEDLSDFIVEIDGNSTGVLTDGDYHFIGQVTNKTTGKKSTVVQQLVNVLPNIIDSTNEFRTTAQKLIEILDTALLNHGPQAYTQNYSIEGRNMQFNTHADFMNFRNQIRAEAARDTRKQQGKKPHANRILVRL